MLKLFLSGAPLQDPPLFTNACDEISRFTDNKCLSSSTPRVDKAVNLILALKISHSKKYNHNVIIRNLTLTLNGSLHDVYQNLECILLVAILNIRTLCCE